MTNLTVLDNVIKAVGEQMFIDELLGRMTAEDAAVNGLGDTIKG